MRRPNWPAICALVCVADLLALSSLMAETYQSAHQGLLFLAGALPFAVGAAALFYIEPFKLSFAPTENSADAER